MGTETEISKLRSGIDGIDDEIVRLFAQRMDISKKIGDFKREHNMAIYDAGREMAVVEKAISRVPEALSGEVTLLMRSLMALAREYQRSLLFINDEDFLPPPAEAKKAGKVVFQGARGAWSMQAAGKIFPGSELLNVDFFEDVFIAVKNREADYGVVPIENSQSGAIGETYDLLRKYGCYVVGRTWIDIRHCLMAKESTKLGDIREVYSHPEGFKQCHRFLQGKAWDLITMSNTAVAAEKVRQNESDKVAAIGAPLAAELNGLVVLADNIVDSANNRTSFVVIGREPEYTDRSDLISITFSLAHRSGSLCEALLPFVAAGINLTRIESRPSSPEHYRFFAEISGNIDDQHVIDTLRHVAGVTEYMEVIGCYSTID
jgi:chorismate mutase/prephenate dehydratase